MFFSSTHLELAGRFKQLGLPWEPSVGNYVYDAGGAVKATSPFQHGVYFLLNYDCFMQKVGGVDRFKEIMTWLPTWDDARQILRLLQVPDPSIQRELVDTTAFERGVELQVLYELIALELERTMASSRDSSEGVFVQ